MKLLRQLARRAPACDLLTAGIMGALACMLIAGIMGAGWSSSGYSMWSYTQTLTDADGDFTTTAQDLGNSKTATVTLDFTAVAGADPKVNCTLYSGQDRTNGYSTGVTFTQVTAKTSETKYVESGKFHQYLWVLCADQATTGTCTASVRTTGKP